jgi:hypothetical protein
MAGNFYVVNNSHTFLAILQSQIQKAMEFNMPHVCFQCKMVTIPLKLLQHKNAVFASFLREYPTWIMKRAIALYKLFSVALTLMCHVY